MWTVYLPTAPDCHALRAPGGTVVPLGPVQPFGTTAVCYFLAHLGLTKANMSYINPAESKKIHNNPTKIYEHRRKSNEEQQVSTKIKENKSAARVFLCLLLDASKSPPKVTSTKKKWKKT